MGKIKCGELFKSMEIPIGFAYFIDDFDFSEALSLCNDFGLDVLDSTIYGKNSIQFFTQMLEDKTNPPLLYPVRVSLCYFTKRC